VYRSGDLAIALQLRESCDFAEETPRFWASDCIRLKEVALAVGLNSFDDQKGLWGMLEFLLLYSGFVLTAFRRPQLAS
jgi:hypothetical protein